MKKLYSHFQKYISTPPDQTAGTMTVGKESTSRHPGWPVDEIMRSIMSGSNNGTNEFRDKDKIK